MSQTVGRFTFSLRMTTGGQFIAELQRERRGGNVSSETEQHLKHEFRRLGWDASEVTLTTVIGSEIDRLERETATLRKLRSELFDRSAPSDSRAVVAERKAGGVEKCDTESWK
jgi:hypothetical protein